MQRYFCNNKNNDVFVLSNDDSYHIKTVMRMSLNDRIEIVFDNTLFIAEIINLDNLVNAKVVEVKDEGIKSIPYVIICQALVKEQKMDYILQKSTELGVSEIIPVNTERSIIRINDKKDKKQERWQKVVKEASEQSKKTYIPKVLEVINLKDLVNIECKHKYICSVNEKSTSIKSVLSKVSISDNILFVIGPEGGFSNNEEKYLLDNGFESITFGSNVLRTETASSFILSVVNYEFL